MDLLTYLRLFEPENLVRVHGNVYCTREHDSLKISNGKWMWWSRGYGGVSALDYLVKVKGIPFSDAMEVINGKKEIVPSFFSATREYAKPKKLLLPEKNDSSKHITKYLMSRGIAKNIIENCVASDLIFESRNYHSCIFVGKDRDGLPRYAAFRGCTDEKILGEATGSDKSYPFRIEAPGSSGLHLFESAIDLLSYATVKQRYGERWNNDNMLSMGGINVSKTGAIPVALRRFLDEHREIKDVHIHFDNDIPGRNAAKNLMRILEEKYRVTDAPPPTGKDFNDYLKNLITTERYNRRLYDGIN